MQFLHSILYLILTIGLVFLYLLFILLLLIIVRWCLRFLEVRRAGLYFVRANFPEFTSKEDLRYVYLLFSLSLAFNSLVYVHQHKEWTGKNNIHLKAKEYWVAGQVVNMHRTLSGTFLHPDNPLLAPFKYIQKRIYNQGVTYLPEDDGEKYLWYNHWFLYPYAQKYLRPYGIGDKEYEPRMAALLDTCWETMQGMMTKKIADKQMQKKYLLKFPFLASYYTTFQPHYTGKLLFSGSKERTNPIYMNRYKTILQWVDTLYESWEKDGYLDEIRRKYPFVASVRQFLVIELLQGLALWLPTEGSFSCDHPVMKRLHQEYETIMSDDPDKNAILNLKRKNKKQARLTYVSAIYSGRGSAGKYLLKNICTKEIPKELYLLAEKGDVMLRFLAPYDIEYVYRKELKPLLQGESENVRREQ